MAKKLFNMVNKNFRLFARSRSSSLVIFLGPLLIVLLVGAAFTNTKFLFNVGTYAEKYTELTDSVVSKLSTSQFKTIKLDSENACVTSVKSGQTQICTIFSKDFEIKEGRTNEVTFYVDFSRINLVYMVLDAMSGRVGERSKEISTSLTEDLLQRMKFTQDTLVEKKQDISKVRADVQTINDQAKSHADTLSSLDFAVNIDAFKINEIAAKVSITQTALTDAVATLEDLETDVDNSNLTASEKSSFKSNLESAKISLTDALAGVQGGAATKGAVELVEEARTALTELNLRFKDAAAKRNKITSDLEATRKTLQDDSDALASTISSLDDVISKLSNLQLSNATQIVTPIATIIKPVDVERSFFSLAFPTLLVLFIMVTGILLSSTMVIVEKKSVAFFRNAITPTTDLYFNLATYLTAFITVLVQVLIFIIIASFVFNANTLPAIPMTLLILMLVTTFFVFTGMIIGFVFKSEETGTLAAITVSSILLFFSSVVLPIETLPPVVKSIADFNPFVISENMIKQALLFKFGFKALGTDLLIFLAYVLILFGILVGLQKLVKSHFLFHRHRAKIIKK